MRVSWNKKIYHVCIQIRMIPRDRFNVFIGTPSAFGHWRIAHPVYHWRTNIRFVLCKVPRCFKSLIGEIGKDAAYVCIVAFQIWVKTKENALLLVMLETKSESLTYHIIVPISVTFVTSTECRVKTYRVFNIFFLSIRIYMYYYYYYYYYYYCIHLFLFLCRFN